MNANDINGFHIELTNMCTLKCPGCARTRFIKQWPQHWKNYNLDINDFLNFLDIDLTGKKIILCGTYGDPIYHPQMIELVKKLKHRGAVVSITTNGSYKSTDWWNKLVNLLDQDDHVIFSIDGSPENFTKYRINGDWDSIRQGIEIVSNGRCNSTWKYLAFAFNEKDIDYTEKLSKSMGIKNFRLDFSDRFDEQTAEFEPINTELLGNRYEKQQEFKNNKYLNIDPKCEKNKEEHYITADGFYTPCCYIADHRFYYKTEFGKNRKEYNIKETTLTQILTKPACLKFYSDLQNTPACQFNCPKI